MRDVPFLPRYTGKEFLDLPSWRKFLAVNAAKILRKAFKR